MDENKFLKIGNQNIPLDALKTMNAEGLKRLLEAVYFDGYQDGKKAAESKHGQPGVQVEKESSYKVQDTSTTTESQSGTEKHSTHTEVHEEVTKIEINISSGSEDPLDRKMKEIGDLVYQFKSPGFVLFRYNGSEEEYLKNKYGFTTLPMKALVFPTMEDAQEHKTKFWGSTYDELQIKQV